MKDQVFYSIDGDGIHRVVISTQLVASPTSMSDIMSKSRSEMLQLEPVVWLLLKPTQWSVVEYREKLRLRLPIRMMDGPEPALHPHAQGTVMELEWSPGPGKVIWMVTCGDRHAQSPVYGRFCMFVQSIAGDRDSWALELPNVYNDGAICLAQGSWPKTALVGAGQMHMACVQQALNSDWNFNDLAPALPDMAGMFRWKIEAGKPLQLEPLYPTETISTRETKAAMEVSSTLEVRGVF